MPSAHPSSLIGEQSQAERRAAAHQQKLLAFFFLLILLPFYVDIAGMRLSPIRIYLLIVFVPFLIKLLRHDLGPIVWSDRLVLCFATWLTLTFVVNNGIERLPYGLIMAVETFGGYLIGRTLIRSAADYKRFIDIYLIALLIIFPLAIYELHTGKMVLRDLFRPIFPVLGKNFEFRYNMSRVQVSFPHSILFGFFCSLVISSVCYLYGDRLVKLVPRLALAVTMTLSSLSSGPMISMMVQFLIVIWGKVTGERWKILLGLVVFLYVFLETFSNRGAVVIFIETFTLNPQTGWWRIYIWRFGSQNVLDHPIFGLGLNDWERPPWLAPTVDNFWLLMAMRHGLPGFLCLALAFGLNLRSVLRARNLNAFTQLTRKAYAVTMVGMIFTLSTVHVWDAMNVFVMMLLGAGVFFYTSDQATEKGDISVVASEGNPRLPLPLSRFSGQKLPSTNGTVQWHQSSGTRFNRTNQ